MHTLGSRVWIWTTWISRAGLTTAVRPTDSPSWPTSSSPGSLPRGSTINHSFHIAQSVAPKDPDIITIGQVLVSYGRSTVSHRDRLIQQPVFSHSMIIEPGSFFKLWEIEKRSAPNGIVTYDLKWGSSNHVSSLASCLIMNVYLCSPGLLRTNRLNTSRPIRCIQVTHFTTLLSLSLI